MNEDDADEQERAEAEALARALEGEAGREDVPVPALEAAALLRSVAGKDALAEARADGVLQRLEPQIARHVRPRSRAFVAGWSAALLAAAAGVLLYVTSQPERRHSEVELESAAAPPPVGQVSPLPAPSVALLKAQLAAGSRPSGQGRMQSQLEREMSAYRKQVLRALRAAYPTHVGQLARKEAP